MTRILFHLLMLAVLVLWCLPGCATVSFTPATGELHTATFGKDISAKGSLPTPNGPVDFEVSSNVNVQLMKAAAEGAATGAGLAVRAAVKP